MQKCTQILFSLLLLLCVPDIQAQFVTTWQVTTSNESITIPVDAGRYSFNYQVNWGDGQTTSGHTGNATHTYSNPSIYTVSITGTFPAIYFQNSNETNSSKLLSIEQWGNNPWVNMVLAFADCPNLVINATDAPDLSNVTDMGFMFVGDTSFNQSIEHWDVSNVRFFSAMFRNATSFNQPLNNWDISNAESISGIFQGATSFNQPLDNWDLSNMRSIGGAFSDASSFNQSLGNWDVSNVVGMSEMFSGATNFNQPLDNWNVSKVTSMRFMFSRTSSFNQPLRNWDVSNVVDMTAMFGNAISFNQPIGNWNVGKVKLMGSMFSNTEVFNQSIENWDVRKVTDMGSMFSEAEVFNQPIGNWNVSEVTDMAFMFFRAVSFNQTLDSWDVGSATDMRLMFREALNFNQSLGNWDIRQVIDLSNMLDFTDLSVDNYDQTLIGWSQLNLKPNLTFDAANLQYCAAEASRQSIINTYNWTINDNGLANPTSDIAIVTPSSYTAPDGQVYTASGIYTAQIPSSAGCDSIITIHLTIGTEVPFITTWRTTNADESITIPTNSTTSYNYTVNWGDGTTTTNHTEDATHTYANAGDYTVSITGLFPRIYFNDLPSTDNSRKLLNVAQWGTNLWTSMNAAFAGCNNLTLTAPDVPDLSNVSDMSAMFYYAQSMNQSIGDWNVSNVTNMNDLFNNATSFNQPIGDWNVSNVSDMGGMFQVARSFNQPIGDWNVSNLTYASVMFNAASSFDQPLNNWDVSNISGFGMFGMFASAGSFNQSLSNWDVSGASFLNRMLDGTNLSVTNYDQTLIAWSQLNLNSFVTLGANGLHYCASEAARQSIIDNHNWTISDAGIGNLTSEIAIVSPSNYTAPDGQVYTNSGIYTATIPSTSASCDSVITIHLTVGTEEAFISTWRTTNPNESITLPTHPGSTYNYTVNWGDGTTTTHTGSASHAYANAGDYTVSITGLFPRIYFNANALSSSPNSNKLLTVDQWGTNLWTSMERAFSGCSNLILTATDVPDLSNVTDMGSMFAGASSFNQSINNWDVSNVTDMDAMFSNARSFNQPLNNWDVSNVTNMFVMFQSTDSFNQPLDNWDVSKVTNLAGIFNFALAFNQSLNNWNVSKVTDMRRVFSFTNNFNQPLDSWNVSNVTTIQGIFLGADVFNQPLNNWEVSKVIDMSNAFEEALAFNQPLDNWNVSNVQQMQQMFDSALVFDQSLADWNISAVTNITGLLDFSHLSVQNYDQTLIAWSQQTLNNDLMLGANGLQYCASEAARQSIIDTYNWTIADNGIANSTLDTAIAACQSYMAPDGQVYTVSGIYTATIPNSVGCDSVITIDLTINQNTNSDISVTTCDSYTAPDGQTYTASGMYIATIPNTVSCDSVISIDLTINQRTSSDISVRACDSYIAPDGQVYTASGMYTATIPNVVSCDSVISIDLTINNSVEADLITTACDSYTAPDGQVYTNSGIYTATIPTTEGCDSIITIALIVETSTSSNFTTTACDSYTAPDAQVYTTSGIYTATIPNSVGCDSVITIGVVINETTTSNITETACDSYTAPDGQLYTESGTFTAIIPNTNGCDSVITIDLTINTIDTTVIVTGESIVATFNNATYRWLDCNRNFAVIPDATGQTFTATENGSYAVEITANGCVDTSACIEMTTVGLEYDPIFNDVIIYPNPTTGHVSIELATLEKATIQIYRTDGSLVRSAFQVSQDESSFMLDQASGVYLIKISTPTAKKVYRIVKL